MGTKLTVSADVEVPRVPNFLRFANAEGTISIADITDESLRELGAEWTEALIAHATELRKKPRTSADGSRLANSLGNSPAAPPPHQRELESEIRIFST